MAQTVAKTNTQIPQLNILTYGIIPLMVLFLFFILQITLSSASSNFHTTATNNTTIHTVTTNSHNAAIVVTGNELQNGVATIPAGKTSVYVPFEEPFTRVPAITLAVSEIDDIDKYYVEDVSTEGFFVIIQPVQLTGTSIIFRATDDASRDVIVREGDVYGGEIVVQDGRISPFKVATY